MDVKLDRQIKKLPLQEKVLNKEITPKHNGINWLKINSRQKWRYIWKKEINRYWWKKDSRDTGIRSTSTNKTKSNYTMKVNSTNKLVERAHRQINNRIQEKRKKIAERINNLKKKKNCKD